MCTKYLDVPETRFGLESAHHLFLKLLRVQAVGHTKHVQRVCVPQRSRAPNVPHSPSGQPAHPSVKSCSKKSHAESNMGIDVAFFFGYPILFGLVHLGDDEKYAHQIGSFLLVRKDRGQKKTWKKHH